jgi:hypothetical protein
VPSLAVPREDDADGLCRLILGQRAQEGINRHALPVRQLRHGEMQYPIQHAHLAVGRNDVDPIGFYPGLIEGLRHRHGSGALQDFRQHAFMAGVQMRHQHERHAGVYRACAEKPFEGFQPAGRSTYSDNGEVGDHRFRRVIHDYPPAGGLLAILRRRLGRCLAGVACYGFSGCHEILFA